MHLFESIPGYLKQLGRDPQSWPTPARLLFFLAAYLGQHTPVGFTWLALPIILRTCGIQLAVIGFMALLYAPWALKFLYAHLADRFFLPSLGLRKSWILPTRILVPIILSTLAFFPPEKGIMPVFILILAMNTALALGDVALDGYAADILLPRERALGAAVQMGANFTGFMVGGGIFLIIFHHMGWTVTMGILAGFLICISLPLFFFQESRGKKPTAVNIVPPAETIASFIKAPQTLGFFVLLCLMALVLKTGYQLKFILLGDLGLSPERIGALVLWAGSPVAIFGTWLGSIFIRRIRSGHIFTIGCLAGGFVAVAFWILAAGICRAEWVMAMAMGAEQLLMGILMSAIYALILQASAGQPGAGNPGAATRFGILCGIQHLTTFFAVIFGGWLGQVLGYSRFFQILALASLLAVIPVRILFNSVLNDLDSALLSPDTQFQPTIERNSP